MTPTTTEDVQAERTLERMRQEIRVALAVRRAFLVDSAQQVAEFRKMSKPFQDMVWGAKWRQSSNRYAMRDVIEVARAAGIDVKAAMRGKS